jgi:hypothetical protein
MFATDEGGEVGRREGGMRGWRGFRRSGH